MIKRISYNLPRSSIFQEIDEVLPEFKDNFLEFKLDRTADGLKADHIIVIDLAEKVFVVEDFFKKEESLFPARIKALASVLKQRNLIGRFRITHDAGVLTCERLEVGQIYSWKKFSNSLIEKNLDKSSFLGSTAIPQELYSFFEIENINKRRNIKLIFDKNTLYTEIKVRKAPEGRTNQILSLRPLNELLKAKFPLWKQVKPNESSPYYLTFAKTSRANEFNIRFRLEEKYDGLELQKKFEKKVDDLRKKGKIGRPSGSRNPDSVWTNTKQFRRSAEVVVWVLQNSEGRCEACGLEAPFKKENGDLFLEVHHAKWLSEGGSDTVSNALAVCPNCHREFHYGKNKKTMLKKIYENIPRLVRE